MIPHQDTGEARAFPCRSGLGACHVLGPLGKGRLVSIIAHLFLMLLCGERARAFIQWVKIPDGLLLHGEHSQIRLATYGKNTPVVLRPVTLGTTASRFVIGPNVTEALSEVARR